MALATNQQDYFKLISMSWQNSFERLTYIKTKSSLLHPVPGKSRVCILLAFYDKQVAYPGVCNFLSNQSNRINTLAFGAF